MQVQLAFLAFMLTTGPAAAQCRSLVRAFPAPGAVIPLNARLILEGTGREAERLARLVGKTLTLQAPGSSVQVRVRRGWHSALHRAAVQLVPTRPLKADTRYTLSLDRVLPGYEAVEGQADRAWFWRTGSERDDARPRYLLKPSPAEGRYEVDAQGRVSRHVKLHTSLEEGSPAYLVVTLSRARGRAQTYFVPLDGGEAQLGHDGCSGAFDFDGERTHRAVIELFDIAGNAAPRIRPIDITPPTKVGP